MSSDRPDRVVAHVVSKLAEARAGKGLSMNRLAWMSGLSPKGIAFIEQGTNSPTLRNLLRIADALEVSLPKLLAEAEKSASQGP